MPTLFAVGRALSLQRRDSLDAKAGLDMSVEAAGRSAQCRKLSAVGRTPWSAADAPVGLVVVPISIIHQRESGFRGTRADQGVRPTLRCTIPGFGKSLRHWALLPAASTFVSRPGLASRRVSTRQ